MTALGLRPTGRLSLSPRRRRSSSSPFAPDQLAGLAVWYRAGASQNTVTDGAVETAFDLSGNGRHGTATGATARPAAATDPDGRAVMRFDGANDSLQVGSPPDLTAGVTVFLAYRIRSHVNGQGIIGAGKSGDGQGNDKWFELTSTFSANRTQVSAKDIQANPIGTAARIDPLDKIYAVFTVDHDGAELRDFLGAVTDTGTDLAFAGAPGTISIGARVFNGAPAAPFGLVDVYEVGIYTRPLGGAELDQIEAWLKQQHAIVWSPGYLGPAAWHDDWSGVTLTGNLVDQWSDRSNNGRHWTASAGARPTRTTDAAGNPIVRFDGSSDAMAMAGTLPDQDPACWLLVYKLNNPVQFEGILSFAATGQTDHVSFWTLETAATGSGNVQVFGASGNANQLALLQEDRGALQAHLFTISAAAGELRDTDGLVADTHGATAWGVPNIGVLGARIVTGAAASFAEVDVAAIVGYTSAPSAADRELLLSWAAGRYGAA